MVTRCPLSASFCSVSGVLPIFGSLDPRRAAALREAHDTLLACCVARRHDESLVDEELCLAGWEVPIAGYFINANDTATYEYDFGDDWRHAVTFEGTDELRKGERALACLAGERRCPPEDCGGIDGYTELLDILTNPGHEEHQSMLEWLGGPYDPEAFLAGAIKFDDPLARWRTAFLESD